MSVQDAPVASQKFTCPRVSALAPACTVAVNVTTVPPATEDTAFPPEVRERVVAVAWDAQAGRGPHQARHAIASAQRNKTSGAGRFRLPTVGRKRISPIFQLKRIFLLTYLTKHVRFYSRATTVTAHIPCRPLTGSSCLMYAKTSPCLRRGFFEEARKPVRVRFEIRGQ